MKNLKLITAIMAIVIAVGGAFATQAEEEKSQTELAMLETSEVEVHPANYRTVPNDPGTCTAYMDVDCNPISGPALCTAIISGEEKQLYDRDNCSILYKNF